MPVINQMNKSSSLYRNRSIPKQSLSQSQTNLNGSPKKISVWDMIALKDIEKHKIEEQKKSDKQAMEKTALRNFLDNQIRQKEIMNQKEYEVNEKTGFNEVEGMV